MLRHIQSLQYHDYYCYNEINKQFNVNDTYISVVSTRTYGGMDNWDRFKALLDKTPGVQYRVLFDDVAINNYVAHRGEYTDEDKDKDRLRQRLIIFEFDEVNGQKCGAQTTDMNPAQDVGKEETTLLETI